MKKLQSCYTENCIPTPTSCSEWNGGDITYLGICNGQSLNNVIWEIITKLQEIAGEDISSFDLDTLITICNQKQPLEINLVSILTLLRDNQVCLKDYINTLNDKLNELSQGSNVSVNLKCYADFDNLGNSLSITREQLDQLVINELCVHSDRLGTVEGKITNLQIQLDNLNQSTQVDELSFGTCIDPIEKPTSTQVVITAQEVCDIEDAIGSPAEVATALAKTPGDLNTEFGLITGWDLTPTNWVENYGNLLLEVENLRQRLIYMEENCCAITCDDVKVGFSVVMNDDQSGVILRFTNGAGTSIPTGFTDNGSSVTITDIDGNTVEGDLVIAANAEEEVIITGLNLMGDMDVNVTVKITNGSIMCEKCVFRKVKLPGCSFCTITATDSVTIIYEITV
jgi:hypothetical protein